MLSASISFQFVHKEQAYQTLWKALLSLRMFSRNSMLVSIAGSFMGLRPNNSFKPTPLRGTA